MSENFAVSWASGVDTNDTDVWDEQSSAEIAAGFSCGPFELGQWNWLIGSLTADILDLYSKYDALLVPDDGGTGSFLGNRGAAGTHPEDIFRVHAETLTEDTLIPAETSAVCGDIIIASGVTLTVDGNLNVA